MTDFNSFFSAIAQQESGGNYSAVNGSSGALGKYQIMPANVPAWSQQYLGVKWTTSQFLGDPSKQDALARAVLQDYYDKYGARGAAAAWYSGNPAKANDYTPQKGGYPSIGEYVDQVLGKAGGGGGNPLSTNIFIQDNTVKQPEFVPQAPDSYAGSGAVSAPGSQEVQAAGADAVASQGAQAVGAAGVAPERPVASPTAGLPGSQSASQDQAVPDYWKGLANQPGGPSVAGARAREMGIVAGLKMIGIPYSWGGGGAAGPTFGTAQGAGIKGFDCSGLVQYVLANAGIDMPRWSYDQLNMGTRTPINKLHPGDLVGFGDGGHIAIYLGNNEILEAPHTGANVRQRKLGANENAWGVSLQNLYK